VCCWDWSGRELGSRQQSLPIVPKRRFIVVALSARSLVATRWRWPRHRVRQRVNSNSGPSYLSPDSAVSSRTSDPWFEDDCRPFCSFCSKTSSTLVTIMPILDIIIIYVYININIYIYMCVCVCVCVWVTWSVVCILEYDQHYRIQWSRPIGLLRIWMCPRARNVGMILTYMHSYATQHIAQNSKLVQYSSLYFYVRVH